MKRKYSKQSKPKLPYACSVITVYIPNIHIDAMRKLVEEKSAYPSRSEAMRHYVRIGLMMDHNLIDIIDPDEDKPDFIERNGIVVLREA